MKKTLTLLILSTFIGITAFAYFPKRKNTISISNNGAALTNYKLLIVFDGSSYITNNLLSANFDDIRFSTESTCPTTFLNHYIERIQAGVGTMWVDMPTFPVGNSTIYMYFGDSTVTTNSNFAAVFPNAYIAPTATSITLTGVQNYDWFEIPVTSTVNVPQGEIFTVNASRIKISGTLNGIGKGYLKGGINSIGGGPGGGTYSPNPENAGAGGGSYAGIGGTGGYDLLDIPGVGGAAYGTASGTDIDFGSAGGSALNTIGGNGGGAVSLNAKVLITVSPTTGVINVSGENGAVPDILSSMGGGGGAGGTIFLKADLIDVSGSSLTAAGGNGTDFPNTPTSVKDGGGGGGGGRIKYHFGKNLNFSGALVLASGGLGGKNGNVAIGQNGSVGSIGQLQTSPYADYTLNSVINYIPCFPLPVTILSFEVSKVGSEVALNWITENEKNASHFEIQHSVDAIHFSKIADVEALNGNNQNKYAFMHKKADAGMNYYRIKQLDIDGNDSYTFVRSILFGQEEEIILFPNPVNDVLSVSINNFKKATEAKIINQFGQTVQSFVLKTSNVDISLTDLPIGVYYFEYNNKRIKFTKQ